ncbi:uncharacterized protein LOC127284326 isoform X2 [Leptopilina boulardi]|nr:uncharacterized protein LOC127284326 isoform X2 [Leptopilina boulardi]XP_051165677.1 uncharacterized protein LOC127284326 isoform X2 [Leptopilina boulardi]XP_051165678.1 uncharacterized protein LOC127284326 isoform X2 [Leptopilina boulardi]
MKMKKVEDWIQDAKMFEEKWDFPNCVGAIDGKHIRIFMPPHAESSFFNYKKFHSFVLLAICDAEYRFSWIAVGDYGSLCDASVFQATSLARHLNSRAYNLPPATHLPGTVEKIPHFFIGDEGFGIKPYMMRPYQRNSVTQRKQEIFNYRLSRATMTIEDTFGIMTSKFQVLHKPFFLKLKTSINIVKALTCLHNFLIEAEKSKPTEDRRYLNEKVLNELHKNGRFTLEEDEDEPNDDDDDDTDSDFDDDNDNNGVQCGRNEEEDRMRRNDAYNSKKPNSALELFCLIHVRFITFYQYETDVTTTKTNQSTEVIEGKALYWMCV